MYIAIFSVAIVAGLMAGSWILLLSIVVIAGGLWGLHVEKHEKQQMENAKLAINRHANELTIRRKQLTTTLNYGLTDDSKWQKEINVFIGNVIEPVAGRVDIFSANYNRIVTEILEATENYKSEKTGFSDGISPIEYEHLVAEQLSDSGWETRLTAASGDQGVDVFAKKNGISIVIQCKLYSKPVGNTAVQEAISGKTFERADFAAVVTNAGFTRSAKQLATTSGVFLLHHDQLHEIDSFLSPKLSNQTAG